MNIRIGQGYDIHQLVTGRNLIIGGVTIPYEKGLLGHSDADVLLHAIIDAMFGACALGDIGSHFPDSNEEYKDASSIELLKNARRQVLASGYRIGNIDATVIAQAPKLGPHIPGICETIANALSLDVGQVSVKAKSNEKLDSVGRVEAIAAQAVVLVSKE